MCIFDSGRQEGHLALSTKTPYLNYIKITSTEIPIVPYDHDCIGAGHIYELFCPGAVQQCSSQK